MIDTARARPLALLPMYDWPELTTATDHLWRSIAAAARRHGIAAPDALERAIDPWCAWLAPNLLVAQTCGLPYVTKLRGRVALLGTPDYSVAVREPGFYHSVVVVRRDAPFHEIGDVRGLRAAYNAPHSQSGYNAPRRLAAPLSEDGCFFGETFETGSHRRSLAAVASGDADIAAIDCVCWALACRHDPEAASELRVLAETAAMPGLPLITAAGRDPDEQSALRSAIREAVDDLDNESRKTLLIDGLAAIEDRDYDVIVNDLRTARALGYPALA